MSLFRMQSKRFAIALIGSNKGLALGLAFGVLCAGWAAASPPQSPTDSLTLVASAEPGHDAGTKGTGSAG